MAAPGKAARGKTARGKTAPPKTALVPLPFIPAPERSTRRVRATDVEEPVVDLDAIAAEIRDLERGAREDGPRRLARSREIGKWLLKAKHSLAGRQGAFGQWADTEFPYGTSWRANLMNVARRWDEIEQALRWAEAEGRVLGDKAYGPDGALKLRTEWLHATRPEAAPASRPRRNVPPTVAVLREQLAAAERQSAESEARARSLETELARWQAEKGPLAPDVRKKASKVGDLWRKGATAGERDASEQALRRMASAAAMSLTDFLLHCAIQVPADWKYPAWAWRSARRTGKG